MTPRQRLEAIRKDSAHIHVLDSLTGIHIGEGARCLDAVRHLFVWNGRYWLYSDEWGGLAIYNIKLERGFTHLQDIPSL